MTWFKVDDKAHANSKIRMVLADEPAALALWVVAGSWSSDALTDGFVPDHQLPWLIPNGAEQLARKLVTARLWRRVRGGYQFHEWTSDGDGTRRNPTRSEVEAERRKKAEAGRRGGLASGKARSKPEAPASAPASAPACQVVEPPTRPDPTIEPPTELLRSSVPPKGGGTARGTRLPDSFAVTPEMVAWAQANTPGVDGRRETERFRDHWAAATGRNATKRDWIAAWRNWMRSAADRAPTGRAVPGARPSTTDQRVAEGLALAARMASPNGTQGMPWNTPKQLSS